METTVGGGLHSTSAVPLVLSAISKQTYAIGDRAKRVKDGVSVDDRYFKVPESRAVTRGGGDFNAFKQGIPRNCRLVGHPETLEDNSLLLVIPYPYQK